MSSPASHDAWDDGVSYEQYVGCWSGPVALQFLRWLSQPAGAAWLDFGCGTGALSRAVLASGEPRLVVGCDRSPGYVAFARERTPDERVRFAVAELPDLPQVEGGFDAAVSGLVLNFLPTPLDALTALATRVRSGGTVAAYVWDYAAGMRLMRVFWDAAVALDAGAQTLDEGARFPLCRPEALSRLFDSAALHHVTTEAIEVPTVFHDFDDYWQPFLGGQGPAPGYARSLSDEHRAQLRRRIREQLPTAPDGTIALTARAWAVKGLVS